ncbi:winged helix DNA-binding domain-containing protein [Humidisolicoccus flavus]|uniref:winged helix DNA-binding domain-containing protein n=1 Tax=Humidisolicoccus flavus TaxID=3111414 RepID=UPI0032457917
MHHFSDQQRRQRMAVRHALHPRHHRASFETVNEAMFALHATEIPTVYLAAFARSGGEVSVGDIDRALYEQRSVVKQMAMRRTLFVFPRDAVPAVLGSASKRVATTELKRMRRDVERAAIADDGAVWLQNARQEILRRLHEHPEGLTAAAIRSSSPQANVTVNAGLPTAWSVPQILIWLGAEGDILRGAPDGTFPTARPRWSTSEHWIGERLDPLSSDEGYRALVQAWLQRFGPGTEDDIVWWLGATKTIVRNALASLRAEQVSFDHDQLGWILPGDTATSSGEANGSAAIDEQWTALLPPLDPTVMGWKDRRFYLGDHAAALFDTRGNAGTTVWVDGRVVGCWVQDEHGEVHLGLLEAISESAHESLRTQATAMTKWLGGKRVPTGYHSPAMRAVAAGLSDSAT